MPDFIGGVLGFDLLIKINESIQTSSNIVNLGFASNTILDLEKNGVITGGYTSHCNEISVIKLVTNLALDSRRTMVKVRNSRWPMAAI